MLNNNSRYVVGYEGLYSVTSCGRVYSHSRVTCAGRLIKGRWLKENNRGNGYSYVNLHKNRLGKKTSIHRIVAEAFVPNPNKYPVVNHIDGDKSNNTVENLEWTTHSANIKHNYDHLGVKPSNTYQFEVFSPEGVRHVSENITHFALLYGLHKTGLCLLLRGKINSHKGWTRVGR